jgi:uncharacterized protein (DUF433 family)
VIPLNQAARSAVESLKQNGQRVFDVDWIKVAWTVALTDAKIKDFRFHDLRHTAATTLADAGTDAFTIASTLGHSTIQMSARYTHATHERERRAVENMSRSQNSGHIPVTTATEHRYVVTDDQILGGEPIIQGTRTPVRAILEVYRLGVAAEEIPSHLPHLTLAQVFDALSSLQRPSAGNQRLHRTEPCTRQ